MIDVKIQVSGGDWSIELERSAYSVRTAAKDTEPGQAREVLQSLFREVDGLLRDRMPAGPPEVEKV